LQARVEANSARILLETSRNDHTAAWRKLASSVGSPDLPPASLAGDLEADIPDISFDDAMQTLLAESPELAVARANVDRAQRALRRACAERIPNVDIQAGAAHDNATHDDIANVQIGLPIPIWNRNQGGIHRAQAELAAAQSDVQRVELDLHHRLASTYQRYANAKQQVDTYKSDILPDAKSSLDLVNNGYKQGEFKYLALLTSQRTFFQTNLLYLESLQELRRSSTEIEGFLLTDSLQGDEMSR
jgi:cobalt-zinc-cadmium efflux system outer membrane protein